MLHYLSNVTVTPSQIAKKKGEICIYLYSRDEGKAEYRMRDKEAVRGAEKQRV